MRKREPVVVLNYWHFITVPSQWLKDTVINKNQNEDTDINLHTNGGTDLNRKFSVEKKISQVSEIHLKKFIAFIDISEMQIKLLWDSVLYLQEWLSSITSVTVYVCKDM